MIDLAATFEEHATEAAAMVWRVKRTPVALRDVVALATSKAQGIVLTEPEFLSMALIDGLRGLAGVIPKPHDDELATADVGITEAFAAVASTGSICVSLGRPLVAASCLLMPLNLILLPRERIVERPRDLFNPDMFDGESLKRNLVFITGPSATADMGPLVVGVHGPHRVLILLLE
jgi:L-lactate dehydrogenase complex protein LldG